jgi:hypothetical protein
MSVSIDFLPELADDPLPEDFAALHPIILRSSCLRSRVQITVDDRILFEYGPRAAKFRSQTLPLLDVAVWGRRQLVTAGGTGLGRYDIPFWWPAIYFGLAERRITITYTDASARFDVGYDELVRAWDIFALGVREFLWMKVPQLRANSAWGSWLEGGSTATLQPGVPPTSHGRTSIQFNRGTLTSQRPANSPFSWAEAPVAALECALEVAVELVIGGVALLPGAIDGEAVVCRTALLQLATEGLQALRWARRFGRGQCFLPSIPEMPMVLWFELIGEDAFVWFNITGAIAQVPYTELLAVWERFVREVREYTSVEMPELLEQPYIGEWLAGKDYEEITAFHPWEIWQP